MHIPEQTRIESLVEICLNTALGFVVSFSAWPFVAAAFGYPYSVSHNLGITAIFTGLSIARGYVVRRFAQRYFRKISHWVGEYVVKHRRQRA
jgi:phosphate/sulfate permease